MRIAIISDIHEDIESLRKVMHRIEKAGYDRLVCLGDISGFSVPYYKYQGLRNAHECLSLLREKNTVIVPGNHDYHAAGRLPQNSPAFEFPPDWYELEHSKRKALSDNKVWLHDENDLDPLYTREDLEYLQTLPEYYVMKDAGPHGILFSHYVWPNMSGFVIDFHALPREFSQHFEFMAEHDCTISFTGHAHTRGYYIAYSHQFRYFRYGSRRMSIFPVCVGIPPVTRHKNRSGFCIFDGEKSIVQSVKS